MEEAAHQIRDHDLLKWLMEVDPRTILSMDRHDYQVKVVTGHPDGRPEGFTLYWTDGVVNEWGEWFPGLPTTLIRLGVLEWGSASRSFFEQEPQEFRSHAKVLLDAALDKPHWQLSVQCAWCQDDIEFKDSVWMTPEGGDACSDSPHDPPVHQPARY